MRPVNVIIFKWQYHGWAVAAGYKGLADCLAQFGIMPYRAPARVSVQPGTPQGPDQVKVFHFNAGNV
jgi:hypothetical protein